jgi:hypothetical protein
VNSKRIPLASTLLAVTSAALALLAAPAAAEATSIWQVQTTANPQAMALTDTFFSSVSASGPDEAWGVGTHSNRQASDQPLVEHWDGTTWTDNPVPSPAGQQATLSGVDDLSSADAWAVGQSSPAGGVRERTLIEHWDGSSWSIVPSPNPATGVPGDDDVLTAVGGAGSNDLWAVGSATDQTTQTISLLFEHWDGTTWSAVPSPTPLMSAQFASSVSAVSSNDVWAVGVDETGQRKTLAAHWNGLAWSIVPTPNVGQGTVQNLLTGVSSDATGDVWASGYAFNVDHRNFRVPYVLRWSGKDWVMTELPNLGGEGSQSNGIVVASPTDVWAVGQTQDSNGSILTLTEQFDGSMWSVAPSPDPGSVGGLPDSSLDAVASAGHGSLFALGAQETVGQEGLRTLALGTTQG